MESLLAGVKPDPAAYGWAAALCLVMVIAGSLLALRALGSIGQAIRAGGAAFCCFFTRGPTPRASSR